MKNCGDVVLQNFLEALVDALKEYNEDIKYSNRFIREDLESDIVLDIPFVISSLWQSFKNDPEKHANFKEDLKDQYCIKIFPLDNYDSGECKAVVSYFDSEKDAMSEYYYVIKFLSEDRYWGYCECTPEDPDYRKDHCCCGHGCDWVAPAFSIERMKKESYSSWNGDEHDYWDFEDSYYQDDKKAAEKKNAMEKQLKIDFLKQQIKQYEDELKELESKE